MVDARRVPFGEEQPRTREDFQQVLLRLCAPFADPDDFECQLAATAFPGAHYPARVARLELMSRLLWGLAPLAAGGGGYPGWPQIRAEIRRGTDPGDPGYWGPPTDRDQRIVESAALGLALAIAPEEIWRPLTAAQRANFAHWLRTAASAEPVDNNWKLFATLVNLGLSAVGESFDAEVTTAAFTRVDDFYRGGGWFSDGPDGTPFDYYCPWAIHFYSLVNAAHGALDPETEARVRERAEAFAPEFARWFAPDGAALPFGRSLTYRFAQASFFGALAFAAPKESGGVGELGWGRIRSLWSQNMRWWGGRPILDGDGTLSVGYAYPNLLMSESYNAPGSPYWAFKAFLPLALPTDHPFWTSPEEPPGEIEPVHAQSTAGFLLQRDMNGHVTALAAAPGGRWSRHGEAKYAKFAYSTAFGFSVPSRTFELEGAAGDSMLLLSDDGLRWRGRGENDEVFAVDEGGVLFSWSPWPDVHIETMLRPVGENGRWHARAHRVETSRELWVAEGGFCVPLADTKAETDHGGEGGSAAYVATPELCAGVADLTSTRTAAIVQPDPNTHLLWPRTLLPTLRGKLGPGTTWLVAAVYADTDGNRTAFDDAPTLEDLVALGFPPDMC